MQKTIERMFAIARMNSHRDMDRHWMHLAQTVHTIVALFLDGGIPPAR
jgi:hypothetical protein